MALLGGKVALVTGAGRGLGRSHALALAAEGARVVVNDVGSALGGGGSDREVADAVAGEIRRAGGEAIAEYSDVSTFAGAAATVERAVDAFGRIDLVVNNAGISRLSTIEELDEATLDGHLGVHLKGTIGTAKAAFPRMRAQGGGRIVNTVSGAGLRPEIGGTSAYACAKAAIYAFTKVAALEGAPHRIFVNAISPRALTRMSEAFFARMAPERRVGLDPAGASTVVVYLGSDLADGLTGRILRIDGGHLCEADVMLSPGASAGSWTPQSLAARMREILHA